MPIDLIEPEQAETECKVLDTTGKTELCARLGSNGSFAVLECGDGALSLYFRLTPESARELGNHLLMCADVLEKA